MGITGCMLEHETHEQASQVDTQDFGVPSGLSASHETVLQPLLSQTIWSIGANLTFPVLLKKDGEAPMKVMVA